MVEIPNNIRSKLDELTDAIRTSEIYRRYEHCRKEITSNPEVFATMDKFRHENFALNIRTESGSGLEPEVRSMLLDRFSVHTNPLIGEYLDAELEMCKLLREVFEQLGLLAELNLDGFSDLL